MQQETHEDFPENLRQAACDAYFPSGRPNDRGAFRTMVLQKMSEALLTAFLKAYRRPPRPAEVQHLRTLALQVWDERSNSEPRLDLSQGPFFTSEKP